MSQVQIVLIRPGATVYDEQHRVQGVLDIPLSDRGRAEVAQLAATLPSQLEGLALSAIYSGPGESVLRTAEVVGKSLGLRPRRVDELRNLDQGLWQGLQIDEIKRRNLRVFRQWLDDPCTVCPPLGETVESAIERIKTTLKPMIKRHQGEAIALIVSEPLAQLVSCYLRNDPHVQLDDDVPTGGFERFVVSVELGRNGNGGTNCHGNSNGGRPDAGNQTHQGPGS
jgi:broad specificity phosphatase PhoE